MVLFNNFCVVKYIVISEISEFIYMKYLENTYKICISPSFD